MTDRVVFDPEIPEPDRDLLAAHEHDLPHPSATVRIPRFGTRTAGTAGRALLQAPLWVYLPLLASWPYGKRARVAGAVAEAAVLSPIVFYGVDGLAMNTLVGVPLQIAAFVTVLVLSGEPEVLTATRRNRGRYIRPRDLDGETRFLLANAQAAVDTVLDSHVHREGLLDDVRNNVTLPRQLWDIAQTLAEVSRLRAKNDEASQGLRTPRVVALLRPASGPWSWRRSRSSSASGPWRPTPTEPWRPITRSWRRAPSRPCPATPAPTATCWPAPSATSSPWPRSRTSPTAPA